MNRDSEYYDKLFESLFPNLKRFDLKEEIEKIIILLKETFIDLEVEYYIRYGRELVFHIQKVARYNIDYYISFDLSYYHINNKDELKEIIFLNLKYDFLKFWKSQILKQ